MTSLRLNAPNDRNGNPRHAYVLIENQNLVAVYDPGHGGLFAVPPHHREICRYPIHIDVSASEYNRFRRQGEAL